MHISLVGGAETAVGDLLVVVAGFRGTAPEAAGQLRAEWLYASYSPPWAKSRLQLVCFPMRPCKLFARCGEALGYHCLALPMLETLPAGNGLPFVPAANGFSS